MFSLGQKILIYKTLMLIFAFGGLASSTPPKFNTAIVKNVFVVLT